MSVYLRLPLNINLIYLDELEQTILGLVNKPMNKEDFRKYNEAIKNLIKLIGNERFREWWEEMVAGPRRQAALANKE